MEANKNYGMPAIAVVSLVLGLSSFILPIFLFIIGIFIEPFFILNGILYSPLLAIPSIICGTIAYKKIATDNHPVRIIVFIGMLIGSFALLIQFSLYLFPVMLGHALEMLYFWLN